MLSCSIWFSAPSFWMGGGLDSCCVGTVYGADGAARHHPHRTHDLRSSCQDHHPSKNSVQKTICCNSTSNAPDDGRIYPKHVEVRIYQYNYLLASTWHNTLFHEENSVFCSRAGIWWTVSPDRLVTARHCIDTLQLACYTCEFSFRSSLRVFR